MFDKHQLAPSSAAASMVSPMQSPPVGQSLEFANINIDTEQNNNTSVMEESVRARSRRSRGDRSNASKCRNAQPKKAPTPSQECYQLPQRKTSVSSTSTGAKRLTQNKKSKSSLYTPVMTNHKKAQQQMRQSGEYSNPLSPSKDAAAIDPIK